MKKLAFAAAALMAVPAVINEANATCAPGEPFVSPTGRSELFDTTAVGGFVGTRFGGDIEENPFTRGGYLTVGRRWGGDLIIQANLWGSVTDVEDTEVTDFGFSLQGGTKDPTMGGHFVEAGFDRMLVDEPFGSDTRDTLYAGLRGECYTQDYTFRGAAGFASLDTDNFQAEAGYYSGLLSTYLNPDLRWNIGFDAARVWDEDEGLGAFRFSLGIDWKPDTQIQFFNSEPFTHTGVQTVYGVYVGTNRVNYVNPNQDSVDFYDVGVKVRFIATGDIGPSVSLQEIDVRGIYLDPVPQALKIATW